MRIYAVDDEELALEMLVEAICEVWPEADVEKFDNPLDCLKRLEEEPCEVLFSDIRMPEMQGTVFAEKCMQIQPELNLFFITAYDDYALDALKLHVSGYLTKPVTAEKIKNEIPYFRYQKKEEEKSLCRIQCYGNFEIFDGDGIPVHFHRTRCKEILAYLTHRMGAMCTVREIAGILFEDEPYDIKKTRYMQKLLSTLTSDLEEYHMGEIVIRQYNNLAIDKSKVTCDYFDNPDRAGVIEEGGEYMAQYSWAQMIY